MKKLFITAALLFSVCLNVMAQATGLTKLYVLNTSGGVGKLLKIEAVGANKKSIDIRPSHWAIIQFNTDSLGVQMKDKPYFLHFERGKSYYFVAETAYFPVFSIRELSEREFLLTIHTNNFGKPEEYTLGN